MMPPKLVVLDSESVLVDGVLADGLLADGLLGELDGELDGAELAGALVGAFVAGDRDTCEHTVEPVVVAEGHSVHDDGLTVFANVPTGHITHLLKSGSLSKKAFAAQ
jgi:hypothetical protein